MDGSHPAREREARRLLLLRRQVERAGSLTRWVRAGVLCLLVGLSLLYYIGEYLRWLGFIRVPVNDHFVGMHAVYSDWRVWVPFLVVAVAVSTLVWFVAGSLPVAAGYRRLRAAQLSRELSGLPIADRREILQPLLTARDKDTRTLAANLLESDVVARRDHGRDSALTPSTPPEGRGDETSAAE